MPQEVVRHVPSMMIDLFVEHFAKTPSRQVRSLFLRFQVAVSLYPTN